MHTLRLIAVALLVNGDDLLMMKRSPVRSISPGKWAGIGGHLEPSEIGNPKAACLRRLGRKPAFSRRIWQAWSGAMVRDRHLGGARG